MSLKNYVTRALTRKMLMPVPLSCIREALFWTISDFSAYAMLSEWNTKRLMTFLYCQDEISSKSLHIYGSTVYGTPTFLPIGYMFRRMKGPSSGIEEHKDEVDPLSSLEVYELVHDWRWYSDNIESQLCHVGRHWVRERIAYFWITVLKDASVVTQYRYHARKVECVWYIARNFRYCRQNKGDDVRRELMRMKIKKELYLIPKGDNKYLVCYTLTSEILFYIRVETY